MTAPPFPYEEASRALRRRMGEVPGVLLVLGSGLGSLVEEVSDPLVIPFRDVPGFPDAGVEGHGGHFVSGRLAGRSVLVQAGRFHLYEGHSPDVIAAPIRIAARMGISVAVLTNAAGGLAPGMAPGTLLLVEDHLNLMGRSPLRGPALEGEERFPDLSAPYDPRLRELALEVAAETGIPLARGVYAGVLGPSYETPAEIRFLAQAGAHAVGMSTVPEVIVARAWGMRVLALSLITNPAAGLGPEPLRHEEVLEVGRRAGGRLGELIVGILSRLDG